MFAEHPAPAKGGKKAPAAKKPEPPKPAAPVLGPPRLVKVVKPTAPAHEPEPFGDEPAAPEPIAQEYREEHAETPAVHAPVHEPADAPVAAAPPDVIEAPEPTVEEPTAIEEPDTDAP